MKIGYVQYPSIVGNRTLHAQQEMLRNYGCTTIYTGEPQEGRSAHNGLARALDVARYGDTLVLTQINHLGATPEQITGHLERLDAQGIWVCVLELKLCTQDLAQQKIISILAHSAPEERRELAQLLRDKQRRDASVGRPVARYGNLTLVQQYAALASIRQGAKGSQVARAFHVDRSAIDRLRADHR